MWPTVETTLPVEASDNDRRVALPDELGLDVHQAVAALLAVELAGLLLMRLPAAQNVAQELKRKLLAAGGAAAVELATRERSAPCACASPIRVAIWPATVKALAGGTLVKRGSCASLVPSIDCEACSDQRRELASAAQARRRPAEGRALFQEIERQRRGPFAGRKRRTGPADRPAQHADARQERRAIGRQLEERELQWFDRLLRWKIDCELRQLVQLEPARFQIEPSRTAAARVGMNGAFMGHLKMPPWRVPAGH